MTIVDCFLEVVLRDVGGRTVAVDSFVRTDFQGLGEVLDCVAVVLLGKLLVSTLFDCFGTLLVEVFDHLFC